ncbi:hypothetical protein JD844_025975 [Phrynosoma platyrhinos]|uniref:Sema domain-containing protein n=1 Tax=Phrynosoma platyrhinos TaxID=52577 RepID=A0ABQ7SEA4_PHRPL|nr:hypothetical protein JD844_025975 [Phrynosoma platyrhinos]
MTSGTKRTGVAGATALGSQPATCSQPPPRILVVDARPPHWAQTCPKLCKALENVFCLACSLGGPPRLPLFSLYVAQKQHECLLPFMKLSDFRGVERVETGRGRCPFEPLQPATAIMADGMLYVATVGNFLGTDPLISRATGSPSEVIRTENSMTWLNDPEFVASAFLREGKDGEDDKVYFFFTETAREYDFYEKVKVARVARVCKGDLGGQKTLQKRWTTFLKAQLLCSDPKSGTIFSVLRDVVTLPAPDTAWNATIFYGVFAVQG